MAPTPARTQSCLARMVAVARWCSSMQAREVASLVALSSSNACSKMALSLRLCQSIGFTALNSRQLPCAFIVASGNLSFCLAPDFFRPLKPELRANGKLEMIRGTVVEDGRGGRGRTDSVIDEDISDAIV